MAEVPEYFYFRVKSDKKGTALTLEDASDADVVEVVRCRECFYRGYDGADIPVCTGAMAYCNTPDDWYCAAGLRKDGGQEE